MRFLLGLLAAFVCLSPAWSQDSIRGAGATFPAAVYVTWGQNFAKESKLPVSYQPTGSGDGIRQMKARAVDFGGTDVPLSQDDLQKEGLLQFPTVVGGVVPVYNLPGVRELKVTGPLLGKIFSGQINNWSDPELAALNHGVALPAMPIVLVVRAEDSGTTSTFTHYLEKFPSWKLGSGLSVQWPAGAHAVRGNDAVGNGVKERAGAIGYVSSNTVRRLGLKGASLQNKSGKFVAASEESLRAAVQFSQLGKGGADTATLLDMPGADSWPMTDATFILVERAPKNVAKAKQTLKFFYWVFLQGDAMAADTGFVPLPVSVQARVVATFRQVKDASGNTIEFLGSLGDNIAALSPR
jgi:phosphate transport system substrate-binding protein